MSLRIEILIFTFYIINQIYIFIRHLTRLVFWILVIKTNLTEVSEQQRGGPPALNVMAMRDQRHANVSKQRMLSVGADIALPHSSAQITTRKHFASRNEKQQEC